MKEILPLAQHGVFSTIQGEGALLGTPMIFIRLAGCNINCPLCDTDYSVKEQVSVTDIIQRCLKIQKKERWIWITGGEPTIHKNLEKLTEGLQNEKFSVAVATAGEVILDHCPNWISVSPHNPSKLKQNFGNELKLTDNINGFNLRHFENFLPNKLNFQHFFVQPCWGNEKSLEDCVNWIKNHPDWRLTIQAHKYWNLD